MEIDFRKLSEVSLKSCEQKKSKMRFFNKSWDKYVYTVCILVMAFNYVNLTLKEYQYSNSAECLEFLFECLLSSTGRHEVLIPHFIE